MEGKKGEEKGGTRSVNGLGREGEEKSKRTKPTSANKLGKSQIPGETATLVITHPINLTTASPKKAAMSPRTPMLRYHTPTLILIGQRGNMTPANTTAIIPTAIASCFVWSAGRSQT